jgi:hypothetical protein
LVTAILNETGAEADVVAVARCFRDTNDTSTGEVAFTFEHVDKAWASRHRRCG